jgi:formate C-acetyltransferase
MTERIRNLLEYTLAKRHAASRRDVTWTLAGRFCRERLSQERRAAEGLCAVLAAEQPIFLPGERIAFTRTVRHLPELHTREEEAALRETAYYHPRIPRPTAT